MQIKEKHIEVKKTARFFVNTPQSEINSVWLLIHGYAQLAKDFVETFEFLDNQNTLLMVPEGLSKFYFRNKIGASWMTREDRLNEIDDYVKYLDEVMSEVKSEFDLTKAEFSLLGFSQGVHTAVRYFIHTKNHFDRLLLCSSDFPKDADFRALKEKLNQSRMFFIRGNADETISEKTYSESKKLLKDNEIDFKDIVFDGGHSVNPGSIGLASR